MTMPPLESSLLKTILFFELLHHRVSVLELARITGISAAETRYGVMILTRKGILIEQGGSYALARSFNTSYIASDQSTPIAWRRTRMIRWIARCNPFIQAIAIGNSLAMGNFENESDIDLFIVAKKNRLYLARLLFVVPLMLLRLRPHETKHAPICVSFMVDETALSMNEWSDPKDIYFAHWCASLIWVYDTNKIATRFMQENASLMTAQGLSSAAEMMHGFDATSSFTRIVSKCKGVIDFNWCEHMAWRFELWYLPHQVCELAKLNTSSVVITFSVFKTHLKDQRGEIATKWRELCVLYGCA